MCWKPASPEATCSTARSAASIPRSVPTARRRISVFWGTGWLRAAGRKPDLLERLLAIKNVKAVLNAVGGAAATAAVYGGAPDTAALAASIGLVRDIPGGGVRFLAMPLPGADGQWTWPRREDARDAAQMVAEAYGQPTLPYRVEALPPDAAVDLHGLEPLPEQNLLLYRSAARQFLYKAEIGK